MTTRVPSRRRPRREPDARLDTNGTHRAVGLTRTRQWAWQCFACGVGSIVDTRLVALERARDHLCG